MCVHISLDVSETAGKFEVLVVEATQCSSYAVVNARQRAVCLATSFDQELVLPVNRDSVVNVEIRGTHMGG